MTELLLFFTGIIVGGMNAIAGGGMLIGFPILMATGMPALVANATTSLIVLPGVIGSVYGYRKFFDKVPRRYLLLVIPTVAGAAAGAFLLRETSIDGFQSIVPLLMLIAVALFAFQPLLHRHTHKHIHGPKKHRDKLRPLLIIALALIPISIYGGFFATGLGFIMLAFLGFTRLHEIHRMTAVKNLYIGAIAATTLACLAGSGLIDWRSGLIMATGNLAGGIVGAHTAQRFSSHAIRFIVIAVGIGAALYLGFRNY